MSTITAPITTAPTPAGGTAAHRPSLFRLTRVELRKLADTRAGLWLLVAIGLVAAVIVVVQLAVLPDDRQTFVTFFQPSLLPVGVLLPVLGILSVTGEWSQRTALTTFALVPQRYRVVTAKIAALVVAALVSVLASVVVAAVGTLAAAATGGAGTWSAEASLFWHAAVFQMINALIGVGFGLLLLNTPLAIVLYLLLPTVWAMLGGMVDALHEPARWLDTAVTMEPLTTGADMTAGQWGRLAVSLLVWLVLPLTAGLVRVMRREVS
ncbi:MAG TPA: ABC transporter permease [Micromonospora sp.]